METGISGLILINVTLEYLMLGEDKHWLLSFEKWNESQLPSETGSYQQRTKEHRNITETTKILGEGRADLYAFACDLVEHILVI